ncbi:hypothetical protein EVAR_99968_1 [Eumeta japonica]|uniref:Uncharacterized protein n=1 Tax=Eumeta variegata TaxID=151549 RepID=A0A4C1T948_EUMVA|nr:hypothetical protein EVAR_99968_1 [Eumeta japonica]
MFVGNIETPPKTCKSEEMESAANCGRRREERACTLSSVCFRPVQRTAPGEPDAAANACLLIKHLKFNVDIKKMLTIGNVSK